MYRPPPFLPFLFALILLAINSLAADDPLTILILPPLTVGDDFDNGRKSFTCFKNSGFACSGFPLSAVNVNPLPFLGRPLPLIGFKPTPAT